MTREKNVKEDGTIVVVGRNDDPAVYEKLGYSKEMAASMARLCASFAHVIISR